MNPSHEVVSSVKVAAIVVGTSEGLKKARGYYFGGFFTRDPVEKHCTLKSMHFHLLTKDLLSRLTEALKLRVHNISLIKRATECQQSKEVGHGCVAYLLHTSSYILRCSCVPPVHAFPVHLLNTCFGAVVRNLRFAGRFPVVLVCQLSFHALPFFNILH